MPATDSRNLQLQISASAELMIRNLKQADAAVADFQRHTDARLTTIDQRFAALGGLKGKLAQDGGGLADALGLDGLAAAVSGAGLVALAKQGLDYASSLGEVAQQAGVSTRTLQEYSYIATQVGVSQEEMQNGLQKLTRSIGEAGEGSQKQIKAFYDLGVATQDVNGNLRSTDDVLPDVIAAISAIQDPAERAAIELDLFGKAGQQLDTLLAGGVGQVNELRRAASDLGIVLSDEQIQNADRTADKISELKLALEANIAAAVAENAGAIYELVNALSGLVQVIPYALNGMGKLRAYFGLGVGYVTAGLGVVTGSSSIEKQGADLVDEAGTDLTRTQNFRSGGNWIDQQQRSMEEYKRKNGGRGALIKSTGKKGKKGKSAEQLARAAAAAAKRDRQDQGRVADLLDRGAQDALSGRADLTDDPEERLRLLRERIDLQRAARDRDLDEAALDNRYIAANLDRLKSINAQNSALDKQLLEQRRAQESEQAENERSRAAVNDQVALLEIQSRLTLIAKDRHAIERRILAFRQQEERDALQRVVDNKAGRYKPEDVRNAQDQLNRLPAIQAAQRDQQVQDQRGVLARYRDQLKEATGDMGEALDGVKVNALQNLEDGLVGLISGTQNVADAFRNMAASIIADLARIAIEKAIVSAIGGSFFGFSDGGPVLRRAGGGPIFGAGGPREDRIPAMLSNGEYVINAASYARHPELVEAINSGRLPGFADGGLVAPSLPRLNAASDRGGDRDVLVRVMLSDDLHATIDNRAVGVAVQVVQASAPGMIDAAATHTVARLRQPSL